MTQKILALSASGPIKVELASSVSHEALGVGLIHDLNVQRYVAQDASLDKNFVSFLSEHNQQADIWFGHFSSQALAESSEIQPFSRSIRGISCLFSMLGELPGINDKSRFPIGEHWPISCADQERAFCLLMERLLRLWREGTPSRDVRLALLADYAGRLRRLGKHSFLFWDGEALYSYACTADGIHLEYQQLRGQQFELEGEVPLRVTAEEEVDLIVIGSAGTLRGSEQKLMLDGQLICFSHGDVYETLDPVSFWED